MSTFSACSSQRPLTADYTELLVRQQYRYILYLVQISHVTVGAVTGGQPDYRCRATAGVLINDTLPGAADNGSFVQCEMPVGNNETVRCTDWEYFGDVGHTIVSQVKARTQLLLRWPHKLAQFKFYLFITGYLT